MFCSDNKHILDLQTIHGQNLWQMYEAKMMIKMVWKQYDIHIQKHVNIYFIKCHLGIFNSEQMCYIIYNSGVFNCH